MFEMEVDENQNSAAVERKVQISIDAENNAVARTKKSAVRRLPKKTISIIELVGFLCIKDK